MIAIARGVAALMVILALVVGLIVDEIPDRSPEHRAGYRVVHGDFHAHTRFSDGVVSPCDLVLLGRRRGLDVIAVTEHNSVFPGWIARFCARFIPEAPVVLVGEEVTTRDIHVLAIGVERDVDARMPIADVVDAVHEQGGVVILAHPTKRFWPAVQPICDRADAIEVVHPLAYRTGSPIGRWGEIVELANGECGKDKAMIGNSDYHAGSVLGIVRTYLFVEEVSSAGVLDAIRDARTVTIAPDGTMFGPDALVEALRREPLAERPTDYGYRGAGTLDRITRALGLFGALLLVVLRRSGLQREKHADGDAREDGDDRQERP